MSIDEYKDKTMTVQDRLNLGKLMARAQTMVLRAFNQGLDPMRLDQLEPHIETLTSSLMLANHDQRKQILAGVDMCIVSISSRRRKDAKHGLDSVNAARTEEALNLVVATSKDRLSEIEEGVIEQQVAARLTHSVDRPMSSANGAAVNANRPWLA